MIPSDRERFIRIPETLFDKLLRFRTSGVESRILLWIIRQTLGWNRRFTPYSWYRIARDLSLDRGGVARSGNRLLRSGIVSKQSHTIGFDLSIGNPGEDKSHRFPAVHKSKRNDDNRHRKRCQTSSVFRRAKDSSKDKETAVGPVNSVEEAGKRRIDEGKNPGSGVVNELMDYYIRRSGQMLSESDIQVFYQRFFESAEELFRFCSGNIEEAKSALNSVADSDRLNGCRRIPERT